MTTESAKRRTKREGGKQGGGRTSARPDRSRRYFHLALIVLLGGIIYSNTLSAPFIFDDVDYITTNVTVQDLRYFTDSSLADSAIAAGQLYASFRTRMIAFFTFALNYRIHGLSVLGYHLFNIAVHIGNALLVYWLVLLTFRTPFFQSAKVPGPDHTGALAAFFAALFFISHPIQTQAITYLSQRFTSLAAFFCLLSLVLYSRARLAVPDSGSPGSSALRSLTLYGFSVFAAGLAMKTKEISFTFPLVIVLYEFFFFKGEKKVRIVALLPLLLTMLIIPLALRGGGRIDMINLARSLEGGGQENLALNYLFTQFRVIVTYLRLLVLPVNQNVDYDYPIYGSFFRPEVFLSFLFLTTLLGAAIYLYHRSSRAGDEDRVWLRLIALGIFWFFTMLSVESTVLPLADVIFEHRLYLPSVGFFLVVAGTMELTWKRTTVRTPILVLLAVVVGLWSVTAYARNGVWGDKVTFWKDNVQKSPAKARPHDNLGMAYAEEGRYEEAIHEYLLAIKLKPAYRAHYNLGIAYAAKGQLSDAIREYKNALQLKPDFVKAHHNLGQAYYSQGRVDDAIGEYLAAIKLKPTYKTHYNLGIAYTSKRQMNEAIQHYKSCLQLKPDSAEAENNLGAVYMSQGLFDEAIVHYETALKLKPGLSHIRNNIELAYKQRRLLSRIEK